MYAAVLSRVSGLVLDRTCEALLVVGFKSSKPQVPNQSDLCNKSSFRGSLYIMPGHAAWHRTGAHISLPVSPPLGYMALPMAMALSL